MYESWGRYPKVEQKVTVLEWLDGNFLPKTEESLLAFGQGRSYGDSCLNDGGRLLSTSKLRRFINFNTETGILRCEAGVTLAEILSVFVPKGWFLPVTPGTKFVSVGGAIANDVHGKNHHRSGTFGCHVRQFELLRSDGERLLCSNDSNKELFLATIGGLGLTGFITWAEIQLKPVAGPYIDMESIKFGSLDEFFEISADSDKDFDYTVAWLDCVASGDNFGRGIFMRGNHSHKIDNASKDEGFISKLKSSLQVPFDAPGFMLNNFTVKAFNILYYAKQRQKELKTTTHYDPFFYPLDAVQHWNRIYGKRGFMQFQSVVPKSKDNHVIKAILSKIVESGRASFLAVLKEFGDLSSPGLLSFPRPGVTLCLDFPNQGKATLKLLRELEELSRESRGAMYPAKDACMSPESFSAFYPFWHQLNDFRDPKFSSSFWRRVTGEEKK